jgi:hypothetical protein
MELVSIWYDRATGNWITYAGEFNSYAEARSSLKVA